MLENCKKCGKMFNWVVGDHVCYKCKEQKEELFQKVKTYINEHKNCSMAEVSVECNVKKRQIMDWINEGRILIKDNFNMHLECLGCGTKISSGRYCLKCLTQLQQELPYEKENHYNNKNKDTKMRFLNNN